VVALGVQREACFLSGAEGVEGRLERIVDAHFAQEGASRLGRAFADGPLPARFPEEAPLA
jgi:hypothetical protein